MDNLGRGFRKRSAGQEGAASGPTRNPLTIFAGWVSGAKNGFFKTKAMSAQSKQSENKKRTLACGFAKIAKKAIQESLRAVQRTSLGRSEDLRTAFLPPLKAAYTLSKDPSRHVIVGAWKFLNNGGMPRPTHSGPPSAPVRDSRPCYSPAWYFLGETPNFCLKATERYCGVEKPTW